MAEQLLMLYAELRGAGEALAPFYFASPCDARRLLR